MFKSDANLTQKWVRNFLLYSCLFILPIQKGSAAIETIPAGSFIINMGITPQTVSNGLRPYGMIYDLIKNYKVPIKWVISQSKVKDGIDFSHNGIDYKGGAFIIPAGFRTAAVNVRIAYWQGQGVVGATTVSPISVDVYMDIKAAPIWTLDDQNGGIAQGYLNNASIPSTAYNWLAPAALTCCNDIFVMPHADPKWPTHGNLYNWNLDCDGAIWLACHAGSALEDLFNPSNKPIQMNFLSLKTGNAVGAGPYEENALVLWGNHSDGSPPYNYAYPTDPIMQFMGVFDIATQNGSEQIYLPKVGWRPGAKVYVWDPTQVDVPAKSPGPAAIMVSGRAFDDPLRGRVMMEAAHSHAKSTGPANIAAQRAFFNFSFLACSEKAATPTIGAVPDAMYSGVAYNLNFTLPPGYNVGDYTILWSSTCGGTFVPNNAQNTTYTPPAAPFPTACILTVTISDACGRVFSDSKAVSIGCNLEVGGTPTSPLCNGFSNGSILLNIVNGTAPYSWNWSRVSPAGTGMGTGTLISSLIAGTYNLTVTASSGCSSTLSVNVTQPAPIAITPTVTNVLCNGASTGAISINVTGGTPGFSFNWGGGITTQNRNNIPSGTYTVTVTDANGCTATSSSTVTQPSMMNITLTPVHVACFGNSTGSISTSVSGGTGTKTYNWSNGSSAQNPGSLAAGTYTVTVTDANSCTKTSSTTINQPAAALSASATQSNVSCNGGNDGSIVLTVSGGTGPFTYDWSNDGPENPDNDPKDLSGLSAGTYYVTVTDANLCTTELPVTITQPTVLTVSASKVNSTCPNTPNGSINITASGGTPVYTYDWLDLPGTSNSEDRTNLLPGSYSVIVTDSEGCTAPLTIVVSNTNNFPQMPSTINN